MIQQICDTIQELSGDYSSYEIFSDWIKAASISIVNATDLFENEIHQKREREFQTIANKHGEEKMKTMAELTGMLALALEENMEDVLGKVYMQNGMGSKQTGQFFTPFHLSYLTANIASSGNIEDMINENGEIVINEPSSGGGGMIIGFAKYLLEHGINYQKIMRVYANDLDWKGCYMSYLQFSLLGIKAKVIQGDTLSDQKREEYQILHTPAWKGMMI